MRLSTHQKICLASAALLALLLSGISLAALLTPRIAGVRLSKADFQATSTEDLLRCRLPPKLKKWLNRGLPPALWHHGVRVSATESVRALKVPAPAYGIRDNAFVYVNSAMLEILGDPASAGELAADPKPVLGRIAPPTLALVIVLGSLSLLGFFQRPMVKSSSASHRLHALDSLRGLAATAVMLVHGFMSFFPKHWSTDIYQEGHLMAAPWLAECVKHSPLQPLFCGKLMVRIFWVLSGLVLSMPFLSGPSHSRLGHSAAKRYFRLMPLAFVTTLVFYVLDANGGCLYPAFTEASGYEPYFYRQYSTGPFDLPGALSDALFFGNRFNTPLWTISYEFSGSMILFGVLGITLYLKRRRLFWAALLLCLMAVGQYFFADFILGLFLAEALHGHGAKKDRTMSPLVALTVFVLVVIALPAYPGWIDPLSQDRHPHLYEILLAASAIGMVALAAFSSLVIRLLMWKPLIWLGERSFALYAVHLLLINFVGYAAGVFFISRSVPVVTSSLLAASLSVIGTFLVIDWLYKHVDRPSMTLANTMGSWFQGNASPPDASSHPAPVKS